MRRPFFGRRRKEPCEAHDRKRISIAGRILMLIGLLTVTWFLITYVLMPVLAMMTVS